MLGDLLGRREERACDFDWGFDQRSAKEGSGWFLVVHRVMAGIIIRHKELTISRRIIMN